MDRIEYRKLNASESGTTWQDSHTLVILTAGACLLALTIALKSILNIPVEQLTMELIVCTTILGGLATSYPLVTRRRSDLAISHPGIWILSIVIITMSIIVLNAI
jgi:uncharacterized membrane protein YhaH (DUF805 family)